MRDDHNPQFETAEQQALLRLLDEFEAPPVSLDFNRRLWRAIETSPCPSVFQLVRTWLKPAIPLGVLAALLIAGFAFDHRSPTPSAPGVTASEADRMERTLDDIQLLGQFEKTQEGDPAV